MATDVATGLRDALMGKDCQPDERTSEQKVRDFGNAACEEAPDLVLPLLCCLRETDEESLRRQLTALRPRLLEVANSLSSFVPGWKENLVHARQTLQEQIPEDYRISWGRELIYHSTACESLGDAVRRLHHEVWRLCELPDGKLTADSVRQSLGLLDVETFRNCCVASRAEIEKAEFLNRRALQESMNDQSLMELLKGFIPDECDSSIAATNSANRPMKTLPDSPEPQPMADAERVTKADLDKIFEKLDALKQLEHVDVERAGLSTDTSKVLGTAEGVGIMKSDVVTTCVDSNVPESENATDDGLPSKLRKVSPSRIKAKSVYDWAMSAIPHAEDMTIVELYHAIECHPSKASEALPPNADSFGRYLRDAGVKRNGKRADKEGHGIPGSDSV